MKIVIAGAGETGIHLAKMLARERHDIVLLDADEENLRPLINDELITLVGNPLSFCDLEEAGAGKADLFVSVTPDESVNITASVIATRLGVRKTFARINNYEYLSPQNRAFFETIGVNSMIYPEMLAAQEIVNTINRPWTRQYWELLDGALVLIGVKIRENSRLVNCRLGELPADGRLFNIVTVKRMESTFIPNGDSTIMAGDIVYFTTTKKNVGQVQLHAGKERLEVRKVLIVGGSRIAMRACQLLPSHIRIRIIEKDAEKCRRIAETAPSNVLIIHGDGRDVDLLVHEGIKDSQAFVGLTDNDGFNIMACLRAKRFANVVKTIAEIDNLDYITLAENMDIGSIVNKKRIAAGHIFQFLLDCDVSNVKILSFADASVAELVAHSNSKVTRRPVKDLNLPDGMILGGLSRNGEVIIINGDTKIEPNDRVIVFYLDAAIRKLEDFFN